MWKPGLGQHPCRRRRDYINSGDNRDPHTNTLPSSTVNGGAGGDEIHGGDGADDMYGGTGSDAQFGDNDPDVINGGSGTADFIERRTRKRRLLQR